MIAPAPEEPDRYLVPAAQRQALWENEIAMFVVLVMPLIVAAFWYGSTVQMVDIYGHITVPASASRGAGVAALTAIGVAVVAAGYLFVQPAAERVRRAQPVRGARRISYAGFVGFLVAINTAESLTDAHMQGELASDLIGGTLGVVAALIAYVSMRSMVDIPADPELVPLTSDWRVRGTY